MKVLFGNVNVGGADASLQMIPEILHAVDVRIADNVFLCGVIHRLMAKHSHCPRLTISPGRLWQNTNNASV